MKKLYAQFLYRWYGTAGGTVRRLILRRVTAMEGGEFFSQTARRILRDYHDVDVGMYTHGGCFQPGQFDRHTTIGRYCSIASDVRTFNRDHPTSFKSTHAFFFNSKLGFCKEDKIEYTPLTIGHDVWIGAGAKILSSVTEIGTGAVVSAQSVVTRDVPPYGVVIGFPARVVRFRFPREIIRQLLASRWWEQDIEEIVPSIDEFSQSYEVFWRRNEQSLKQMTDVGSPADIVQPPGRGIWGA
jgi:virginiamycin A acetyltransferase